MFTKMTHEIKQKSGQMHTQNIHSSFHTQKDTFDASDELKKRISNITIIRNINFFFSFTELTDALFKCNKLKIRKCATVNEQMKWIEKEKEKEEKQKRLNFMHTGECTTKWADLMKQ